MRVNAIGSDRFEPDLDAVVRRGWTACAAQSRRAEEIQSRRPAGAGERAAGRRARQVRYIVAIESPRGLLGALRHRRGSSRVAGLMFGAEDFGPSWACRPTAKREGEQS